MYDADLAREAYNEAKAFDKRSDARPEEKQEAYRRAAELFEPGITMDKFAASNAIRCWRKSGEKAHAREVAQTAIDYFPADAFVRSNAAWCAFDKLKESQGNFDEAIEAARAMVELMTGLTDASMLAEQLTRQLIRLSPHGEPAPTEVLDLLVRHADVVFDAASTKVDERSGVSAKQRLAQYLREELVAAERWDDVIELMTRATEAFPHDRSYAVALVRGFYEMGHFEEAQTEAEHALLEEPDPVLVKLQVAALEGLGRSEDADEAMLAGCYRSGDFELWRDLAARRFRHEDIDGAMRALAVARRLLSRMKGSVVRQWEARLHKGRATGLYRLERYQEAAIELLAGLDAERNHGQEPDPDLAALKERFPAEQPDAWAEAEAAMADGTIVEKLGEMLMAERNRELELGLRPAYFVFVDTDKGFGYLVLGTPPADEPTEPSEVQAEDRVYVSLRTITGKTEGLAAGDRVQALTTPISVADARQIGANRRAVFVRISAASAS